MLPDPNFIKKLKLQRMPFGKYKGRLIIELPTYYLEFLARDGFQDNQLGQYLSTMHIIRTNGLMHLLKD